MPKGQRRGNRETKKPKTAPPKTAKASPPEQRIGAVPPPKASEPMARRPAKSK